MKTVIIHLKDKHTGKEMKSLIHILEKYEIKVVRKEIIWNTIDGEHTLLLTDNHEEASEAERRNITVIAYEEPEAEEHFYNVDLIVQGFEEVDAKLLQLVYMRHHKKPWPIAETESLILRESIPEDFEAIYAIYKEQGITDYIPGLNLDESEEKQRFQSYIESMYPFYGYGLWTVIERDSQDVIGLAGLENMEYRGQAEIELGYLIGNKWQGLGYGNEAAGAVVRFFDDVLEYPRLFAMIHPDNKRSIRIAEKQKFVCQKQRSDDNMTIWIRERSTLCQTQK